MKSDELAASPPSHLGSLGGLLRWYRLRLGLSQESLAEALGVSTRSIRRWEQDLALPQELSRQRLGHLLGMDLEHILALGAIGQHEPAARSLPAYSVDRLAATFEQGFLLLESKLRPPRLPSPLIERERLLTRLEAAREHQLTVLCAPAGWGKTTLLSTWAARCQEPVAWVSLEALDADPTRFWVLAMTALRQCGSYPPSLGDVALAMLHSCEPPALTTVLTALIQQIESTAPEAQTMLILDDYQMIEDPTTHESVLFLLEHLPASLHLVLSSRVEPALPLSRLRLRSQVLELRDAQLRLTEDEARSFLTAVMGYQLTQEDVHLLQERTEGWIAGLQLAALALRDRLDRSSFIKMFGGHHRVLLDYVQQEILERQTQPIQSFLLQTSVLTQMNAALCQAVTGQQASQHLLEELERAHLFVVALDEQRHWYRLHGLFREALLARLSASQPAQVPLLHQRAAHWYEQQGGVHKAMTHALAAGDVHFAACLLERYAERLWLNAGAITVHDWIQQLPDEVLRAHAPLALTAALHLLHHTQYTPPRQQAQALTHVEQTIARVEELLKRQGGNAALLGTQEQLLHQRIRLLRGLIATREAYQQGNGAQVHLLAQSMQQEALQDELSWMMIPIFTLYIRFVFQGDVRAVFPPLLEMKQRALQAHDRHAISRTMQWVAVASLRRGQLRLTYQHCLHALELLKQRGEQTPTVGYLHLELAALHWMWNQMQEAQSRLSTVMHYARTWQNMDLLLLASYWIMQVLLTEGKHAEAAQMQEEVEQLAQRNGFMLHRPRVRAARVQLWLAEGKLQAAATWADTYHFTPDALEYISKYEDVMLARVYLAQEHYRQAYQVLLPLLGRAQEDQRSWDVASLLALEVMALHGMGQRARAKEEAARLLQLTALEGYVRIYLDAGEPMRHVLQRLIEGVHEQDQMAPTVSPIDVSYVAQLLTAFAQEANKSPQAQQPHHCPQREGDVAT